MSGNSAAQDPGRQARLEQVLADYLHSVEQGRPLDRSNLIDAHPDLAADLQSFFRNHDSIDRLAIPLNAAAAEAPTITGMSEPEPAQSGMTIRYFGDYELLEEIARGGMGVVYKARQVNLNRVVALKMILAGQLANDSDVKRFYAEAEAAARLDHPGIVPIFEIGQYEGQNYFSMAFVEGESLAKKVANGPLPARDAAALVKKVAEAVEYAHEKGIIHRDLKPANVLLDGQGHPKVTDFGLAKQLKGDSGLTGTGQILGTPSYMPPEQAAGKLDEVGPQSDVYALGAILYCLLTGRPPFQAANPLDTLMQVLEQEPVSVRLLNPQVPLDLETIALKCLEKDPRRRYAAARELADELDRFREGRPILARPVGSVERLWRWCRRNPKVAALAAAVFVLLVTVAAGSSISAIRIARAKDLTEKAKQAADNNYRNAETQRVRAETAQQQALANLQTAESERRRAEANFAKARDAVDQMLTRVGQERLIGVPQMEPVRRALLEDALRFYQGFLQEKSGDPAVRMETARAYSRVADICATLGQLNEAHQANLEATQLYHELAAAYPDQPEYRSHLAQAQGQLGLLLKDLGRPADSRQAYDVSVAALDKLVVEFPENPVYRSALASTLTNLGVLYDLSGQFADAEPVYRRAVQLGDELIGRFAGVPSYESAAATHIGNLARLLKACGRLVEAEQLCRRGNDIEEGLVARFPASAEYRNNLAKSHHNLGVLLHQTGRADEAERAFQRAAKLHDKLAGDFPHVVEYRQDQAKHYNSLGLVYSSTARPQQAEEAFVRAIAIKQKLAADLPTVALQRAELANSLTNLATFRSENGQAEKSLEDYRRGIALLNELIAEYPGVPGYHGHLGAALNDLARLTRHHNLPEARRLIETAIEHQKLAIQINPREVAFQRLLRIHCRVLSEILMQLGQHTGAAQAALDMTRGTPDRVADCYRAACFLARCVSLAKEDAGLTEAERELAAENYSRRAVEQLKSAIEAGYKSADQLPKDQALESLHQRDDFRALFAK